MFISTRSRNRLISSMPRQHNKLQNASNNLFQNNICIDFEYAAPDLIYKARACEEQRLCTQRQEKPQRRQCTTDCNDSAALDATQTKATPTNAHSARIAIIQSALLINSCSYSRNFCLLELRDDHIAIYMFICNNKKNATISVLKEKMALTLWKPTR